MESLQNRETPTYGQPHSHPLNISGNHRIPQMEFIPVTMPLSLTNFPSRLYDAIAEAETGGFSKVITWQPHGRAFMVHDRQAFVENILPIWFTMKSFASFQRQLNLYGFQRITSGMDKGGYFHKFFLRGNKDGICYIQRQRIKGRGPRTPDSTKLNPNFYAVEFMPPLESDTPGPEVKEEHYNSSAVVDIQKAITNTSRNSGGGGPVLSSAAVDISRPRSNQEHGCCFHQHNNNQYRLYADLEPRRLFPPETITTTRVIHEADRNQPLSWYYSPPCLPNSNELPWSTLSQEDTPVEDDLPIDTEVTPASAPARAALMSSSLNFDDNYQHYDENAAAAAVVAADSVDDYLEPLPF